MCSANIFPLRGLSRPDFSINILRVQLKQETEQFKDYMGVTGQWIGKTGTLKKEGDRHCDDARTDYFAGGSGSSRIENGDGKEISRTENGKVKQGAGVRKTGIRNQHKRKRERWVERLGEEQSGVATAGDKGDTGLLDMGVLVLRVAVVGTLGRHHTTSRGATTSVMAPLECVPLNLIVLLHSVLIEGLFLFHTAELHDNVLRIV